MQPGAAAEGAVKEHDLVEALRNIPESDRGWQTATRSVKCQSCQAISVFKPERVAQNCDFCGSPALVPYDEIKAPIRPESVLPFKLSQGDVRDKVRAWYREPLVCAQSFQEPRLHRHHPRALSALLDVRRAGRRANGPPRRATITTRPRPTVIRRETVRRARCNTSAGNTRAARLSISSMTNWCPLRAACRRSYCEMSNPSPPTN